MLKRFLCCISLVAFLFTMFAGQVSAEDGEYDPSCVLVVTKRNFSLNIDQVNASGEFPRETISSVEELMAASVPTEAHPNGAQQILKFNLTEDAQKDIDAVIIMLLQHPLIEAAEKNYITHLEPVIRVCVMTEEYAYINGETTVKRFLDWLQIDTAVIKNGDTVLGADALIPTGATLTYQDAESKEKQYTFILLGDVDCDGKITAFDARQVLRVSVKLEQADTFALNMACDFNPDYKIMADDARRVLRYSVKLENKDNSYNVRFTYIDRENKSFAYVGIEKKNEAYIQELLKYEQIKSIENIEYYDFSEMNFQFFEVKLALHNPEIDELDRVLYLLQKDKNVFGVGIKSIEDSFGSSDTAVI